MFKFVFKNLLSVNFLSSFFWRFKSLLWILPSTKTLLFCFSTLSFGITKFLLFNKKVKSSKFNSLLLAWKIKFNLLIFLFDTDSWALLTNPFIIKLSFKFPISSNSNFKSATIYPLSKIWLANNNCSESINSLAKIIKFLIGIDLVEINISFNANSSLKIDFNEIWVFKFSSWIILFLNEKSVPKVFKSIVRFIGFNFTLTWFNFRSKFELISLTFKIIWSLNFSVFTPMVLR